MKGIGEAVEAVRIPWPQDLRTGLDMNAFHQGLMTAFDGSVSAAASRQLRTAVHLHEGRVYVRAFLENQSTGAVVWSRMLIRELGEAAPWSDVAADIVRELRDRLAAWSRGRPG